MNVRATAILAATLSLCAASAQANLLTNPGAETGDLTGWTAGGMANPTVDSGTFNSGINPKSGSFDFVGFTSAADSLTQSVTLPGAATTATVSFWEQGLNQGTPSDDAFISLTFHAASGAVLGTVSTPEVDSHDQAWQNYTGSFAIPDGTVVIDYTMNFIRHAGSDNDSYVDDNSLTVSSATIPSAVPEPGTYALMVAGLGVLGLASRRRKA